MSEGDASMLDAGDKQDQGKTGEEQGNDRAMADAALLARAATIAEEAASGLLDTGWNYDWVRALQALAALVTEQARQGDPAPAVSADRLRVKLSEIDPKQATYWRNDETGKKKLANACKMLGEFERFRENLSGRARTARVPAIVRPQWEKRGRDNAYWLQLVPIELPARPTSVSSRPEEGVESREKGSIIYREELEVPLPILKRPFRVSVQGWRGLVLIAPILFTVLVLAGLVWLLLSIAVSTLPMRVIFQWSVIIGLIGALLGWCTWPLFRLVEDGIIMAPDLFQIGLPLGHVLVVRDEAGERVIRMVRYVGESCPVCSGNVTIRHGRGAMKGRLVGACGRNPIEHLFSFDHVTRRGRILR